MDASEALDHLQRARGARVEAERTPVSAGASLLVGVLVFAGFAALGLFPLVAGWRVVATVVAFGCWGLAGWLVLRTRVREGVRGLHGQLRSTAVTLGVCTVPVAIAGLHADADLRKILMGLGVLAGLAMGRLAAHQEGNRG